MSALQLRAPDDFRRLLSALSPVPFEDPAVDLSLYDIDERALMQRSEPALSLDNIDGSALALSVLVAMATAWVAVRAYERHGESMTWALAWGAFGYLLPLPAVAASYYLDVN